MRNGLLASAILLVSAQVALAVTPTATATATSTPTPVATSVVSVQLTSAQHTAIQTTVIPLANAALCRNAGLPTSCIQSDLTAACAVAPQYLVTRANRSYRTCTLFTLNAAGEGAWAADRLYQDLLREFGTVWDSGAATFCVTWKALGDSTGTNTAAQDAVCTTNGSGAGCVVCQ